MKHSVSSEGRNTTPALVLASHTSGLGVIRALGAMGVPVSVIHFSKNDFGHLSRCVTDSFFTRHPEESEQDFVSFLTDTAEKYEGSVLIPTDDATLVAVSRNKEFLERYYHVACPDWDITERIIDKKYTYALAEKIGIPVPKTFMPSSVEEAKEFASLMEFPCLIKPSVSHRYFATFNVKMVLVHDEQELLDHYLEATQHGLEVMIQEFIPGDDTCGVNLCSYRCADEPFTEFTAEKVRLYPKDVGAPCVIKSKKIPEIIQPGRRLLEALHFSGFSCTEFKRDVRNGTYKFMEINGRQNLSVLHAMRCGINFPWIAYNHLASGELQSSDGFRSEIYWIDLTRDFISTLRYRRGRRYSLLQHLKPYVKRHVFAIFDLKDIKPFIKRGATVASRGVQALFARVRGNLFRYEPPIRPGRAMGTTTRRRQ